MKKSELERWQRDLERREQVLEERIAKLDKQYAEEIAWTRAKYHATFEQVARLFRRYSTEQGKLIDEHLDKQEQVLRGGVR